MKEREKDAPIGKPVDNLRLYIVDKKGHRLPQGAIGELWISGPQVTRGYLNRPEKNAESYLVNPFDSDPSHSRIYRSGDIVRYLPDGNIQFVGRQDSQVKIRGFRIELKEVEAVIREFPGITDATVQAFDYENGGKFIAAYIVAPSPVDVRELNAFIQERKPPYMVPAATMQIDRIPLTQNLKVDRRSLPTPVMQSAESSYVAPENELEKCFTDIFAKVLSLDKVSATDDFFALGGTSLMVTRVIIEADKAGHYVAYRDLFEHPSARQIARFLQGGEKEEEASEQNDTDVTLYDYTVIDALLKKNKLDAFMGGERLEWKNVLLTGATGFLGIHVLYELIQSGKGTIYCLVRGKSQDDARKRLQTLLFYYFDTSYQELIEDGRLRVIAGDVTQDISKALGDMDSDAPVDTLINCAANVKHFSEGTDIEDVNIGGAVACVNFCLRRKARLIHISTASTGGLSLGDPAKAPVLDEQKLYFGQYLDNAYIHSKFISERVVLEAVACHGLVGKVIRVGNLSPRSTDGEFQINFQTNSAMGRVRAYSLVGGYSYAESDSPMEFSPINETARSILLLATTPRECCLFQSYNNHYVFLGDVLDQLRVIGIHPAQMETEEFARRLDEVKNDPKKASYLTGLLAYQDMAHGKQAIETPCRNEYTTQVLYRLGFKWSVTSWDYVDRFLVAIHKLGYFQIARNAGAGK